MPKTCKKCGSDFPTTIWIGEKKRNLCNRKYCFDCSPFGEHNTKKLEPKKYKDILCRDCGKKTKRNKTRCQYCWWKIRQKRRREKVHSIVGYSCWICGWNMGEKGYPVLEFHHMDPSDKKFPLTRRETTNYSWEKVYKEMRKCTLLCCLCHRKLEYNLLDKKIADKVYFEKWGNIENPRVA